MKKHFSFNHPLEFMKYPLVFKGEDYTFMQMMPFFKLPPPYQHCCSKHLFHFHPCSNSLTYVFWIIHSTLFEFSEVSVPELLTVPYNNVSVWVSSITAYSCLYISSPLWLHFQNLLLPNPLIYSKSCKECMGCVEFSPSDAKSNRKTKQNTLQNSQSCSY